MVEQTSQIYCTVAFSLRSDEETSITRVVCSSHPRLKVATEGRLRLGYHLLNVDSLGCGSPEVTVVPCCLASRFRSRLSLGQDSTNPTWSLLPDQSWPQRRRTGPLRPRTWRTWTPARGEPTVTRTHRTY